MCGSSLWWLEAQVWFHEHSILKDATIKNNVNINRLLKWHSLWIRVCGCGVSVELAAFTIVCLLPGPARINCYISCFSTVLLPVRVHKLMMLYVCPIFQMLHSHMTPISWGVRASPNQSISEIYEISLAAFAIRLISNLELVPPSARSWVCWAKALGDVIVNGECFCLWDTIRVSSALAR